MQQAVPDFVTCISLDATVRQVDRDEWECALDRPFLRSLFSAIRVPHSRNRALTIDGECICMWGTHDTDVPGVGQAWLAASDAAYPHVHRIHALWSKEMGLIHDRWPLLVAYSLPTNTIHHTWMLRRGFRTELTLPLGHRAIPFLIFTKRG